MEPFNHNKFLGYVSEVTPQFVKIQFPTANLLQSFYHDGNIYAGGNVGCFVVIEGAEYGSETVYLYQYIECVRTCT